MTKRYTIEQLNAFRVENGFAPVFGLSQRSINAQCKEWEASKLLSFKLADIIGD